MRHAVGRKESPPVDLVGGRKATAVHPEAMRVHARELPLLRGAGSWVGLEAMDLAPEPCSPTVSTGGVAVPRSEDRTAHGDEASGLMIRQAAVKFSMAHK